MSKTKETELDATDKKPLMMGMQPIEGAVLIPVEWIRKGRFQPRTKPITQESIEELAASIKEHMKHGGIIEPIIVRPVYQNAECSEYEIVAGERRWRAAQLAGLHDIPSLIKNYTEEEATAIALIENIQRENLNTAEEARAIQKLMDFFDLNAEEVGKRLGKKGSTIRHSIRLLGLEPSVLIMLEEDKITAGHARALLMIKDHPQQLEMAKYALRTKCSVRTLEKTCSRITKENLGTKRIQQSKDPDIFSLETRLSEILGTQVSFVMQSEKGGGKTVIHWNNLEELEGQLEKIQGYDPEK